MVVRSVTGGCPVAAGVAGFATGSRTAPGSLALADDSAQVSRRYVSQVEVDVIDPPSSNGQHSPGRPAACRNLHLSDPPGVALFRTSVANKVATMRFVDVYPLLKKCYPEAPLTS